MTAQELQNAHDTQNEAIKKLAAMNADKNILSALRFVKGVIAKTLWEKLLEKDEEGNYNNSLPQQNV